MGMTRQERTALHKKQERTQLSEGVPTVAALEEGVPVLRSTNEGLVQYVKYKDRLYKSIYEEATDNALNNVKFGPTSLSSTGYVTFGNGLIFQWGRQTTDATVTFPIPFPTTCFNIVTGKDYGDGHGTGMPRVLNITRTNFEYDSSNQADTDGYWLAIGY